MQCSKCGKIADKEFFTKSNITKDGKRSTCKECKYKMDKEYRIKNKDKLSEYFHNKWHSDPDRRKKNTLFKELRRTGLNATKFVEDKCCEKCGMTNNKHREKYNERLHIHHTKNNGRKNIRLGKKPEHNDLQILCRSCHVREDNLMRGKNEAKN